MTYFGTETWGVSAPLNFRLRGLRPPWPRCSAAYAVVEFALFWGGGGVVKTSRKRQTVKYVQSRVHFEQGCLMEDSQRFLLNIEPRLSLLTPNGKIQGANDKLYRSYGSLLCQADSYNMPVQHCRSICLLPLFLSSIDINCREAVFTYQSTSLENCYEPP